MKFFKLTAVLLTAAAIVSLSGCGKHGESDKASEAATKTTEVKLGVVGEQNEPWEAAAKTLEKEGIKLTLVKFADYTLPNTSLQNGDIDLNAFQHTAFLNHEIKDKNLKLVPIGDTIIAPLSLFSKKYKSLEEFKNGDTIAIPNDPTNGGRALKLLESAGLIKVDPAKGYVPTVRDVTENPKHIKFYEVDAANTFSLLPDVAGSVINSNYAIDNGVIPQKDAIYLDKVGDIKGNPYVNVIVAREADKDNPVYQKVVKAYQTKEVADVINKTRKGAEIPVFKY